MENIIWVYISFWHYFVYRVNNKLKPSPPAPIWTFEQIKIKKWALGHFNNMIKEVIFGQSENFTICLEISILGVIIIIFPGLWDLQPGTSDFGVFWELTQKSSPNL